MMAGRCSPALMRSISWLTDVPYIFHTWYLLLELVSDQHRIMQHIGGVVAGGKHNKNKQKWTNMTLLP